MTDKLLAAVFYVLGFFALIFVSIGLSGDTPLQDWGPGTGFAIVGIAIVAVIVRRRSRRENEIQGESTRARENPEADVLPVKGRLTSRFLEAMLLACAAIVIVASYIGVGGGVSWKIWGSGLAVGVVGFVVGWVMLRREKNSDEEKSNGASG
jgi:membrane protein implicated in regulation of membrane protease activity